MFKYKAYTFGEFYIIVIPKFLKVWPSYTQFRSLYYLSEVRTYVISGGPSLPDFLSLHFANLPELYLLCSLGGGGGEWLQPP